MMHWYTKFDVNRLICYSISLAEDLVKKIFIIKESIVF